MTAVCGLLYRDRKEVIVVTGRTPGTLVEPRGQGGFGWDAVFQPRGEASTYAEMEAGTKNRIGHRGRAWRDLLRRLGCDPRAP